MTTAPVARNRARPWAWALPAVGLLAGCLTSGPPPAGTPSRPSLPAALELAPAGEVAAPVRQAQLSFLPAAALGLPDLLDLATRQNPALPIARAQAEAARGRWVQAGLYPNPLVAPDVTEVGNNEGLAGEPGVTIAQEFVTAGKLRLAKAAAAQGVAAAEWDAVTRWYEVATRVRVAYVETLTAAREVKTSRDIVELARQGLATARKLEKAGLGSRIDVLRAEVELEQVQTRLGVAQRRQEAAWRLLAAAVGVNELPAAELQGRLEAPPPEFAWRPLHEGVLQRSSEIQRAVALQLQAEQQLRREEAQVVPNVILSARPLHSFPNHDTQADFSVGVLLPVFNRNQGNIASARADLARTAAEVRQTELRLTERLADAFRRYQAARQQAQAHEKQILPSARESVRLVALAYQRGDPKYDYTAVLQAQTVLFQAELVYVQALGELWRAVSEIAGLLQTDDLGVAGSGPGPDGCARPGPPVSPPAAAARAAAGAAFPASGAASSAGPGCGR